MNLMRSFSRAYLRRLYCDRRGNVVIIFALTLIPVLGLIGGAVDYTRAFGVTTRLQGALDAAVLASGSFGAFTNAQRIELGRKVFAANTLDRHMGSLSDPIITIDDAEGTIRGSASAKIETYMLGLFTIDHLEVGATSVARLPKVAKAEIALVLDYSGSMNARGKYQAMRNAAIDFVNITMKESEETKIGLVPFSEYVYTDIITTYIRGVHPDKYGQTVTACLNSRRHPYAAEESTPIVAIEDSKWSAPGMPVEWTQPGAFSGEKSINEEVVSCKDLAKSEEKKCKTAESDAKNQCKATEEIEEEKCDLIDDDDAEEDCEDAAEDKRKQCDATAKSEKNQCVADAKDLKDADQCFRETGNGNSGGERQEALASDFADENAQCADYRNRSVRVVPLTTDTASLVDQLNKMVPIKMTNIALALEFGWHMVSPNEPMTEGVAYNDSETLKAIVLLSDGTQTVGGYGPGKSFNIAQADQNTRALCDGIKARSITMVTVAFDLRNNSGAQKLLSECASGSDYFFDAETNTDLAAAFRNIAMRLQKDLALVE